MITYYIQAARPKTLIASIAPVLMGTGLAFLNVFFTFQSTAAPDVEPDAADAFLNTLTHCGIFVCTLFCAVLLQIASNLFNDAIDYEKGSDNDERFGPTRVTQAGFLTSKQVKKAGITSLIIAIALGLPLVIHGGMLILLIGLSAGFFSWAYTGGPYPLAYNGLGELFVLIYYGIVAVAGSYFLQTLEWNLSFTVPTGIACGAFGMALIGINNFRDINQDRVAGKKTLAVRFGETFSKVSIVFFLLAPYGLIIYLAKSLDMRIFPLLLPLLIPGLLTAIIIKKLSQLSPSSAANKLLGLISLNQIVFTVTVLAVPIVTLMLM